MKSIKLKLNKIHHYDDVSKYGKDLKDVPANSEVDLSDSKTIENKFLILFEEAAHSFAHLGNINGKNLILPEPNMTILYYYTACNFYNVIRTNVSFFNPKISIEM